MQFNTEIKDFGPLRFPVFAIRLRKNYFGLSRTEQDGTETAAIPIFTTKKKTTKFMRALDIVGSIETVPDMMELWSLLHFLKDPICEVSFDPFVLPDGRLAAPAMEIDHLIDAIQSNVVIWNYPVYLIQVGDSYYAVEAVASVDASEVVKHALCFFSERDYAQSFSIKLGKGRVVAVGEEAEFGKILMERRDLDSIVLDPKAAHQGAKLKWLVDKEVAIQRIFDRR